MFDLTNEEKNRYFTRVISCLCVNVSTPIPILCLFVVLMHGSCKFWRAGHAFLLFYPDSVPSRSY